MITVFIGTFNRLSTLQRSVESYARLTGEHELVIVDNGTDHPDCLDLLSDLSKRVKKVYHLPGCDSMFEATDNFNIAVRDQFEGDGGEWFAISEADISFEGARSDSLEAYMSLSEEMGVAVGPHLRVSDVPACYPLRSRVLACESRLLYRYQMSWYEDVPYTKCQTDTTFHLFPRIRKFERLHLNPLRVGPPFDCAHLDWYLDIFHPTAESTIYLPGLRPVGSWGKSWIRAYWQWFQALGAEKAFELLLKEPVNRQDLCNVSFMISWAYQYGIGCEPDRETSQEWLELAIPPGHEHYWPYIHNWLPMVYENDFSSLGWDAGAGS